MRYNDDDGRGADWELPAASPEDPRVTITGADRAADAAPWVDEQTLLPHWTDAPTGQVPVVVARESAPSDDPWSAIPAPAWREDEADWVAHEDQFDAPSSATTQRERRRRPALGVRRGGRGRRRRPRRPGPSRPGPSRAPGCAARMPANPLAGRAVRQRPEGSMSAGHADRGRARDGRRRSSSSRGRCPSRSSRSSAIGLAAGEAFAGLRQVGAHPATILGIVAFLTLMVAVYNKGAGAIGAVTVLTIVFAFLWYLSGVRARRRPRRRRRDDLRLRLGRRARLVRAAARRAAHLRPPPRPALPPRRDHR